MLDPSWELIETALTQHHGDSLWLLDENIPVRALHAVAQMAKPQLQALTNRFDIHLALDQLSIANEFSDFEFSTRRYSAIFFRLGKEKALNHYLINQAFRHLQADGLLYVAGAKNEGIKSLLPHIESLFAGCEEKRKGSKQSQLGIFRKLAEEPNGNYLDDNDYATLRPITADEPPFYSKPGQFGWNKIDKGSAMLMEFFPQFLASFKNPPGTLLDLGCGYGYLCCKALQHPFDHVVATDNNAAAIIATQKNLELHGVTVDGTNVAVIADDCAQSIKERFHCIICNPPFHQGFSVSQDLTDKFLLTTQRLLKNSGRALFVVNQFIPLEKKAQSKFADIVVAENAMGFKLVTLAKPKALR